MQIVLKEDIDKLGRRGEVVKVADGYARNYLLPLGKALPATQGNLKVIEREKRRYVVRLTKEKEENETLSSRIQALSLTLVRKVGEGDVLYGSVTSGDIAEALSKEGIVVDKRRIQLGEPIKSLGIYTVPIRLHPEVTTEVKVWVAQVALNLPPGTQPEGDASYRLTADDTHLVPDVDTNNNSLTFAVFFVVVGATFALGIASDGAASLIEERQPLTFLATFDNVALGTFDLIGRYLTYGTIVYALPGNEADPRRAELLDRLRARVRSVTFEYGNTFLLTAGLMNILLILDAFDIATGRKD